MWNKAALISLAIILAIVNGSIFGKEKLLAEGKIVYLELAPIDPRSLMQGDYMALRFHLSNEVRKALSTLGSPQRGSRMGASNGYAVLSLDENRIGSFERLQNENGLSEGEVLIRYRMRKRVVKLATNAFFFQEGRGESYQAAKYGQFRVDKNGEVLLAGMYDQDLKELGLEEME